MAVPLSQCFLYRSHVPLVIVCLSNWHSLCGGICASTANVLLRAQRAFRCAHIDLAHTARSVRRGGRGLSAVLFAFVLLSSRARESRLCAATSLCCAPLPVAVCAGLSIFVAYGRLLHPRWACWSGARRLCLSPAVLRVALTNAIVPAPCRVGWAKTGELLEYQCSPRETFLHWADLHASSWAGADSIALFHVHDSRCGRN
ncbi:hypothetical protein BD413DRAFT_161872 [Trametes elegans]|nr:hypothetical protein BD413DRAFT_161872 [Trametes elegans]